MRNQPELDDDGCAIVTFTPAKMPRRKTTATGANNVTDATVETSVTTRKPRVAKGKPLEPTLDDIDDDATVEVDFTPMTLPPASDQQRAIIGAIADNNVIIDSVAGSGKTTTSLHIATEYHNKNILLLTYNSDLRKETRAKAQQLGINNLTAHTFHSLGYAYISKACATDNGLIKFMKKPRRMSLPSYDIIIIDECQDMKTLFYFLITKVLEETSCRRLCVVGDVRQAIYRYAGADPRFITLAPVIYKDFPPDTWARHQLTTSYRITRQIATFVNECILGENLMFAVKDGPKPNYNMYPNYDRAAGEVIWLLANGYAHGDIFILAPSVRSTNSKNPIKQLANKLTELKIPIYIPINDDAKLDPDVARGKIVFSSFHQSKGLERRATIVLGIDASYHKYYATDEPTDVCPNAMYVALTRAKEYLSVYHINRNPPLSFIDLATVAVYANVSGVCNVPRQISTFVVPESISVSKLVRHITSEALQTCMDMITMTTIRAPSAKITVPTKVRQNIDGKFYSEEVSEITGTAIPAYYEHITTGQMTIADAIGAKLPE